MEQDRYQQNSKLFIIGLICLLLSLGLFALSLYILPYLLWNWNYSVPETILTMRQWFVEHHNFSERGAGWMVFLTFMIPALICGFISQFSSNHIEKELLHIKKDKSALDTEVIKKDVQETLSFGLKIFLLIVLVLVVVLFVEWLIAPPLV